MRSVHLLVLGLFAFSISAYLLKNILPYALPLQYQPSVQDIEQGGYYDYAEEKGVWHGEEVTSVKSPNPSKPIQVLGTNSGNKRIEVDLTNQKVYAYEGDARVFEFTVSTGKWGATPTGTFTIAYKNYSQKMSGGSKALGTYYYLPNVHHVQFFGNDQIPWSRGFSFHEAYWHNNFGHPMSHGCINMKAADAEALYNWTTPDVGDKRWVKASEENSGTTVIIYGTTPRS